MNEFWRLASNTTITVTTSGAHGIAAISASSPYPAYAAPFKIIPRTGTGTGTTGLDWISNGGATATGTNSCVTDGTCIVTVTGTNQFTYMNGKTGQQLAAAGPYNTVRPNLFGSYDLIVPFLNGTGTCSSGAGGRCTVYVTAPNHGLIAGDQIRVILTSGANTNIIASNGTTVTVLATPAPTANTFAYTNSSATANSSTATGYFQKTALYSIPKLIQGNPVTYTIQPVEYCSDEYLNNCIAATAPSGGYIYPAPVRFCLTEFDANRWDTPTGKERTNVAFRCQKKFNPTAQSGALIWGISIRGTANSCGPRSPRERSATLYGPIPAQGLRGKRERHAHRELHRQRRAHQLRELVRLLPAPHADDEDLGEHRLQPARQGVPRGLPHHQCGHSARVQRVSRDQRFRPRTQKTNWYSDLFAQTPGGGTPLPFALSRAGRYFAGKNDGINKQMVQAQSKDPLQYSCQQNFALLTTDGYWNRRDGKNLGDTSTSTSSDSIGNRDNTFSCVANDPHAVCGGTWDGYTQRHQLDRRRRQLLQHAGNAVRRRPLLLRHRPALERFGQRHTERSAPMSPPTTCPTPRRIRPPGST